MKKILLTFAILMGALFITPTAVYAGTDVFNEACNNKSGANSAVCSGVSGANPVTGQNGVLIKVSRIIAIIAGITAVIMMMVGGFMFITSAGDAGKATSGRNTIIYAFVGLLVIALSQAIITLFVNTTNPN